MRSVSLEVWVALVPQRRQRLSVVTRTERAHLQRGREVETGGQAGLDQLVHRLLRGLNGEWSAGGQALRERHGSAVHLVVVDHFGDQPEPFGFVGPHRVTGEQPPFGSHGPDRQWPGNRSAVAGCDADSYMWVADGR